MKPGPKPTAELVRFIKKYMIVSCGCWLWLGRLSGQGYGVFDNKARKSCKAHRFAYENYREPIPEGLETDHLCRNRCCVNPWHLEPVTHVVNLARGLGSYNSYKTHCVNGHPLSGDNVYPNGTGRQCKTCARGRSQKRHYANKLGGVL